MDVHNEAKPAQPSHDEPKAESDNGDDCAKTTGERIKNLDERSKSFIALVMFALCLSVFLSALDICIVTTALPTIADHFNSSNSGYIWIGAAYVLAGAAATPVFGKTADIFGTKPLLLLANALFFIGSLIAALSINIGMLIAARTIQGIGGGGILTVVDTIISDWVSLKVRTTYLSFVGLTWSIAMALGPVIGGAFTEKVTWRWCFYINLPLDGLSFFISLFFLDVKTPKTPVWAGLVAIDWLGTFLITGATLIFLFGLEYGGVVRPWGSAEVVCLLVFGIVTAVIFVLVEWKFARYPLMPLRLFNSWSRSAIICGVFLSGFPLMGVWYYLPLYFQAVLGATPLLSGVYLLPACIATGFSAMAAGAFVGITGKYRPPIYFSWVAATLGFGLFISFDSHHNWAKIIIYQIIVGFSIGPAFQAPLVGLQAQTSPGDVSVACAAVNFFRQIASGISVVVGQAAFQNRLQRYEPELIAHLGPSLARQLGGANVDGNIPTIDHLDPARRTFVREILAKALQPTWIMYTGLCAAGLALTLLIRGKALSGEHTVRELGLEAEARHKEELRVKKEEKKASEAAEKGEMDVAAGSV